MASEVVHHVALSAEALAAVLGAIERPVVVVYAHVDRQVVPVVERLLAGGHSADEVCPRLMVSEMSFEVLAGAEFLGASAECALEYLRDFHNLAVLAAETLAGKLHCLGVFLKHKAALGAHVCQRLSLVC